MKRHQPIILLSILLIVGVGIPLQNRRSLERASSEPLYGSPLMTASIEGTSSTALDREIPRVETPALRQPAESRLLDALAELRSMEDTQADPRLILANLRSDLASLPPTRAVEMMVSFLGQKSLDAETGLGFTLGPGGLLEDHPTLRVALLDWLGQIDLRSAGIVAEQVLSSPTHADEWCVCLRNFARSRPTSDSFDFLRSKTEELILHPDWRSSPTAGYLEAFDVLVYSQATESTALLADLVADRSDGNRAVAHASFVALDRLVLLQPEEMFRQFARLPGLAEARGPMLANLMARADLRDEGQRDLVRQYLLDPGRQQQELEAFAEAYPNANHTLSLNLLTGTKAPEHDDLVSHDRAVQNIVDGWAGDPAFEPIRPVLETMQDRLATFVSQAVK